jgi:hypothetical protein
MTIVGGIRLTAPTEGLPAFLRDYGASATARRPILPYVVKMDKQETLRRVAEANRLLVEGRRTIDRQRDLIARLERMGIDTAKQHGFLTILVEAQADREERLGQLLEWLESQPSAQTAVQHAGRQPG